MSQSFLETHPRLVVFRNDTLKNSVFNSKQLLNVKNTQVQRHFIPLMNKPTVESEKKQQCEWKDISNPHTSLWKKSLTFTFVEAGTSISALCSVLAGERKSKDNEVIYNVYRHFTSAALQGGALDVSSVNITSPKFRDNHRLSKAIKQQQALKTTQKLFTSCFLRDSPLKSTKWSLSSGRICCGDTRVVVPLLSQSQQGFLLTQGHRQTRFLRSCC